MMVNVLEALDIDGILEYFGFNNSSQRTIIASDGFDSHSYIVALGDSDVFNLSKGFYDRPFAVGNISFGWLHKNLLKATIH